MNARARERRRLRGQLPCFAEAVARELHAGAALLDGFAPAADLQGDPVAAAVAGVVSRVEAGSSIADALGAWHADQGLPELEEFVMLVLLAMSLGGELAPGLEAGASAIRDRAEVADELRSLTAQARASAMLLSSLPVAAVVGMGALEPATVRFLFGTSAGAAGLVLAFGADSLAWWWMRSLVRRAS